MVARKVLVVLAVLSILAVCAVPAFALSDIPPSDEMFSGVTYSFIPFDYLSCSEGVFEWPYRQSVAGSSSVEFQYKGGIMRGDVQCQQSNSAIVGSFFLPIEEFTLYSTGFTYTAGAEYTFRIVPTVNSDGDYKVEFGTVDISFTLWDIGKQAQDQYYRARPYYYTGSFVVDPYWGVDIGKWFAQAVSTLKTDGKYLITDLSVSIPFSQTGVDTPEFTVVCDSTVMLPVDPATWIATQRLTHTTISGNPAYFDATSWLASAVGAFLSFEIAPGFSIDNIFWMILVVLCILWFLTLIL